MKCFASMMVLLVACTPTDPEDPPPLLEGPLVAPTLSDIANYGDARDVQATWIATEEGIHRLYLLAEDAILEAGDTWAAELSVGASEEVSWLGTDDVLDHRGEPLVEGRPYVARLKRLVDGVASQPSAPSTPLTLGDDAVVRTIVRLDAGTGGMEVDDDGTILMGDFGTFLSGTSPGEVVYRITPEGAYEVFARGQFGASGNALDADGYLLQSSIVGGYVSRISPEGVVTTHAYGLSAPVGVAVHPDGTMFVANCGNATVTATDPIGETTVFASSTLLRCPNGIALASDGNLYVANFSDNNLLSVAPDGTVQTFVSLPGSNLGHVTFANDRLYVAVRGTHQLAEVTLGGEVRILAGSGARGRADGAALSATLSFPNDLAFSTDGALLYFNDTAPSITDPNQIGPTLIRVLALPRSELGG